MAELKSNVSRDGASSIWTLRLAGSQDNANPNLWAPHARATGYGPRRLAGIAWRRRWLVLGVFAVVFLPAAALVRAIKPSYEASLLLSIQSEQKSGENSSARLADPLEMMSEIATLRSPELMHDVAQRLELGGGTEEIEQAGARLEQDVRVGRAPGGMIAMQYADGDPNLAAAVLNTLADLYVEKRAADGERALTAVVVERATPPEMPAERHQAALLLLSLLAAAGAALGLAARRDARVKPVARVAEIAMAAGAPVLMMVEETQSHVS